MYPPQIPKDEEARLASLFRTALLDGFSDERFRPITELATKILKRPSAAVSVITGHRQLLRAAVNIDATDLTRETSFCGHAILNLDQPLIVEDARLDPRFVDNPIVTARRVPIRFYAGMPIKTPDGLPFGALCVFDHIPGKLTDTEILILRQLAAEIEGIVYEQQEQNEVHSEQAANLHNAVNRDELKVFWQPICDPGSLSPVGHEALVRWLRSDGTFSLPDSFMPLAARSGTITKIDRYVLKHSCAKAALHAGGRFVSVNISSAWFGLKWPALAGVVAKTLTTTGLAPGRLVIELAEGVLARNPSRVKQEMEKLKALGVRVALDRLGGGESAFSYFEGYPFDIYKLSRSITSGLGVSVGAEAAAYATIRVAHSLGRVTYAVGVENRDQLAFLRDEACDLVQGDFIAPPGREWRPYD
ncbi:sensor domain-containing phosphodiesterase [Lichenicoccus roseus]|uniref:EAL domain-containing protein n=1 Tax=Lichenicoccus roseus TaxID=2683649 RepID=A0A5R9J251_9PROT|nr:EAL domain-containing protein [Lichenicoccus roseus]TLU70557.1 EAL domain-containing protein [Lichenicoccus roseus]